MMRALTVHQPQAWLIAQGIKPVENRSWEPNRGAVERKELIALHASSKREMAPEVLARLFQERSQSRVIRFDESTVPGTSPADLDLPLARRFMRDDAEPTEVWLRKMRIVADDNDGEGM